MSNIKKTTVRFNLDNELHCKIWELLQNRDLNKYPTYSQIMICALSEFLGIEDKPYRDKLMSEITETVEQTVDKAVERILPSFLAGYMACTVRNSQNPTEYEIPALSEDYSEDSYAKDEAADIDFGFMGL